MPRMMVTSRLIVFVLSLSLFYSESKGNTADVLNSKIRSIVEARGRNRKNKY